MIRKYNVIAMKNKNLLATKLYDKASFDDCDDA